MWALTGWQDRVLGYVSKDESHGTTLQLLKRPHRNLQPGLKKNRRRVDNKPDKPKPNVKSTRQLADDVKAAAAKRAAQQRMRQAQKRAATAKKIAKPAAVAAGLGVGAVALNKATKPKPSAASSRRSGPSGRGSNRPANRRNTTAMSDAQKRRQVSQKHSTGHVCSAKSVGRYLSLLHLQFLQRKESGRLLWMLVPVAQRCLMHRRNVRHGWCAVLARQYLMHKRSVRPV